MGAYLTAGHEPRSTVGMDTQTTVTPGADPNPVAAAQAEIRAAKKALKHYHLHTDLDLRESIARLSRAHDALDRARAEAKAPCLTCGGPKDRHPGVATCKAYRA